MNEWVWSNGGMVLTGENWSTGRETLYSVGGRWMNGYGAMVEWYWQGKAEVLGRNVCWRCSWATKGNGEVPNTMQGWQHSAGTNCLKMADIWGSHSCCCRPTSSAWRLSSIETSGTSRSTTRRHIAEDWNLQFSFSLKVEVAGSSVSR